MKKLLLFMFCILLVSQTFSQEKKFVARKDFEVSKDWQPRQIMGKDFWHLRSQWYDSVMDELDKKPMFNEAGFIYQIYTLTVPGTNLVSITSLPEDYLDMLDMQSTYFPNVPFFMMPFGVRTLQKLMKDFDHDMDSYNTWKDARPNFMGWMNAETGYDFLRALPWKNGSLWQEIVAEGDQELIENNIREFPRPENKKEITMQFLKGLEANRNYFFNDNDNVHYLRAYHCFDHYFLESGAELTTLETTNSGSYRNQVSLFFTRGAAHQYKKNWMWYNAFYYNGFDDQGNFSGDNAANYLIDEIVKYPDGSYEGPGAGMSTSLITRNMFLAYLSGSSFLFNEGWFYYLHEGMKDGKPMWDLSSPYGEAWEDWFDFTRENTNRGTNYAPVALLVPFTQGYQTAGGESWGMFNYERPDWMIDAFMFSIVPHSPMTNKGDEGVLSNSPFGDIYDVITPDTPQKPVALEVLNNYKVAVMLGEYAKDKALSDRIMEYVENGGTLLLNINQINEFFPTEFLGFERMAAPTKKDVKGPIQSLSDGENFTFFQTYEMEPVTLNGAVPLLEDADGNILACQNSYGKGNVIVATVDYLVPKSKSPRFPGSVHGREFPFVDYFLGKFVKEVLPLQVKGDIEYGLNKLSDDEGWLLYLINNKGVTKFTNKAQVLDISKTATVEVSLRGMEISNITELREQVNVPLDDKIKSFTIDVPPGGIKVVKIEGKYTGIEEKTRGKIERITGIYPNPVEDIIYLKNPQNVKRVTLYTLSGKVVMDLLTAGSRETIDASTLPIGSYLVTLETMDGKRVSEIVIKK